MGSAKGANEVKEVLRPRPGGKELGFARHAPPRLQAPEFHVGAAQRPHLHYMKQQAGVSRTGRVKSSRRLALPPAPLRSASPKRPKPCSSATFMG